MPLGTVIAALKFLSTDAKGILPLNSKIPCGQYGDDAAAWKSGCVPDVAVEPPIGC